MSLLASRRSKAPFNITYGSRFSYLRRPQTSRTLYPATQNFHTNPSCFALDLQYSSQKRSSNRCMCRLRVLQKPTLNRAMSGTTLIPNGNYRWNIQPRISITLPPYTSRSHTKKHSTRNDALHLRSPPRHRNFRSKSHGSVSGYRSEIWKE